MVVNYIIYWIKEYLLNENTANKLQIENRAIENNNIKNIYMLAFKFNFRNYFGMNDEFSKYFELILEYKVLFFKEKSFEEFLFLVAKKYLPEDLGKVKEE